MWLYQVKSSTPGLRGCSIFCMNIRNRVQIPRPHVKPNIAVNIYNPSTHMARWEAETGESPEAHRPDGWAYVVVSDRRPCLKQESGLLTLEIDLWPPCVPSLPQDPCLLCLFFSLSKPQDGKKKRAIHRDTLLHCDSHTGCPIWTPANFRYLHADLFFFY